MNITYFKNYKILAIIISILLIIILTLIIFLGNFLTKAENDKTENAMKRSTFFSADAKSSGDILSKKYKLNIKKNDTIFNLRININNTYQKLKSSSTSNEEKKILIEDIKSAITSLDNQIKETYIHRVYLDSVNQTKREDSENESVEKKSTINKINTLNNQINLITKGRLIFNVKTLKPMKYNGKVANKLSDLSFIDISYSVDGCVLKDKPRTGYLSVFYKVDDGHLERAVVRFNGLTAPVDKSGVPIEISRKGIDMKRVELLKPKLSSEIYVGISDSSSEDLSKNGFLQHISLKE